MMTTSRSCPSVWPHNKRRPALGGPSKLETYPLDCLPADQIVSRGEPVKAILCVAMKPIWQDRPFFVPQSPKGLLTSYISTSPCCQHARILACQSSEMTQLSCGQRFRHFWQASRAYGCRVMGAGPTRKSTNGTYAKHSLRCRRPCESSGKTVLVLRYFSTLTPQ